MVGVIITAKTRSTVRFPQGLYCEWKIENFLELLDESQSVESPEFWFSDCPWYFKVFTKSTYENEDWISLYLMRGYYGKEECVLNYKMGIKKNDGSVYLSWNKKREIRNHSKFGEDKCLKLSKLLELKDVLLANGTFTICCMTRIEDNSPDVPISELTDGFKTLTENLAKLDRIVTRF